ncbi:transposase [Pelosinus fermentans]|uniref:Transposase IS200-family protein n=1 Tax=Pelosinus fermentans JBW45 TaxID=1192197 RepID=A0A0C5Q2Q0_9FIRM|nr:transposase [Pelosinus fermentans]AJQ29423.1 transposase IS200-family protein [Pelosinus fermentans JBW45]
MPRYARIKSQTQVYHIMLRGNNREKIFVDEEDKARMIDTLGDKKKAEEYFLYAYCVMDNHIHLIIKEGKDPIASIVKRIATSYSYYFNKKYKRIGHVFQERFKSENIEDDSYLLAAIRYVHQNPVKPGIGTVDGYKWSSYRDYIGIARNLTDTREVLGILSNFNEKALMEFVRFNHEVSEGTFLDVREEKEIDQLNVNEYINRYLAEKGIGINDLRNVGNKSLREELVKLLMEKSNLSLRGIAETLELNREMVRKAQVSKDLSP